MRKGMRRTAILAVLAASVSFLCPGCSEKPDAEAYVNAALDAIYHRECGEYAEGFITAQLPAAMQAASGAMVRLKG